MESCWWPHAKHQCVNKWGISICRHSNHALWHNLNNLLRHVRVRIAAVLTCIAGDVGRKSVISFWRNNVSFWCYILAGSLYIYVTIGRSAVGSLIGMILRSKMVVLHVAHYSIMPIAIRTELCLQLFTPLRQSYILFLGEINVLYLHNTWMASDAIHCRYEMGPGTWRYEMGPGTRRTVILACQFFHLIPKLAVSTYSLETEWSTVAELLMVDYCFDILQCSCARQVFGFNIHHTAASL